MRRIDGADWRGDERDLQSQLFLPAGAEGPALLLHPNFAVIRRYNNSDRYALVVALLARAFDGRGGAGARLAAQRRLAQPRTDARTANAAERPGLRRRRAGRPVRLQHAPRRARASRPSRAWPPTAFRRAACSTASAHAPASRRSPRATPRGLERTGIRELQRLLNRLGYSAGRADGVIGARTRDAIRAFERAAAWKCAAARRTSCWKPRARRRRS